MTSQDFSRFKLLAEALIEKYTNPYKVQIQYWRVEDLFNSAKLALKYQNKLLRDGHENDEVRALSWFDESVGDVKWFSIKANKRYSLMEWYSIYVLNSHFATLQKTYQAMSEFDFGTYKNSSKNLMRKSA